ncbi:MAG: ABC transporter ATP-binding protein [Gemmatimonadota bacterium]|jgi:ABC-2 type transport system ATP-binding protein
MRGGIALEGFGVEYPDFTLGPLDLSVEPGERVALVGSNGAGKSTTMRALSGRFVDYHGRVRVGGEEVRDRLPGIRARIGLLPERLAAFGWMTVAEHLSLLEAVHPRWDASYGETLRGRLDLPASARVGTLSRGMKIKLSFIAAEAFRPPLLLLDEPTAGLDPAMRMQVLDLIREATPPGAGRVVVFSSHLMEDVQALADRVLVLRDGALVGDVSVEGEVGGPGAAAVTAELLRLMHGRG